MSGKELANDNHLRACQRYGRGSTSRRLAARPSRQPTCTGSIATPVDLKAASLLATGASSARRAVHRGSGEESDEQADQDAHEGDTVRR